MVNFLFAVWAHDNVKPKKKRLFGSAGDIYVTTNNKLFVIKIPLGSSELPSVPIAFVLCVCVWWCGAIQNIRFMFLSESNWFFCFLFWTWNEVYRWKNFANFSVLAFFSWDKIIGYFIKGNPHFYNRFVLSIIGKNKTKQNNKNASEIFTFF